MLLTQHYCFNQLILGIHVEFIVKQKGQGEKMKLGLSPRFCLDIIALIM